MADDPATARGRAFVAQVKSKLSQVQALGAAAERLDLETLVVQGLGLLLGEVDAGRPKPPDPASRRLCVAPAHAHNVEHFARLAGCVEGPDLCAAVACLVRDGHFPTNPRCAGYKVST